MVPQQPVEERPYCGFVLCAPAASRSSGRAQRPCRPTPPSLCRVPSPREDRLASLRDFFNGQLGRGPRRGDDSSAETQAAPRGGGAVPALRGPSGRARARARHSSRSFSPRHGAGSSRRLPESLRAEAPAALQHGVERVLDVPGCRAAVRPWPLPAPSRAAPLASLWGACRPPARPLSSAPRAGPLTQSAECHVHSVEVTGSNPVRPTTSPSPTGSQSERASSPRQKAPLGAFFVPRAGWAAHAPPVRLGSRPKSDRPRRRACDYGADAMGADS